MTRDDREGPTVPRRDLVRGAPIIGTGIITMARAAWSRSRRR